MSERHLRDIVFKYFLGLFRSLALMSDCCSHLGGLLVLESLLWFEVLVSTFLFWNKLGHIRTFEDNLTTAECPR
jgi:hypothetical protein